MKKAVLSMLTVILILGIISACGSSYSQTESSELIIAVESSVAEAADTEESEVDSVGEAIIIEEAEESSAEEDVVSEEAGLDSEEKKELEQSNNPFSFTTIEEGKLRMATEAPFAPYVIIDDSGILEGIDVEIAEAIAERLGLELEVEEMPFDALLGSVRSGQADIAMAGITVTEERKSHVDFTVAYDNNVQAVIVPADSDIQTADDLREGTTIGVLQYSTGEDYCTAYYDEAIIISFSDRAEVFRALLSGSVDAVVVDKELAEILAASNEGLRIFEMYTDEEYAIAVSKENPALLEAVSTTLEMLIADGTVQSIIDKYKSVE